MSEPTTGNVVRDFHASLASGAPPQTIAQLFSEDAVFDIPGPVGLVPWIGKRHGRQGVANFVREHRDQVAPITFELTSTVVEGERGVAVGQLQSRVRATGRLIESAFAAEFIVRDGKITFYRLFEDSYAVAASILNNSQLPRISNPLALYDPTSHGYSHVGAAFVPTRTIVISGQFGVDPSGTPVAPDLAPQAHRAVDNVEIALRSEGLSLGHIIKLTVLIVSLDDEKLATFETVMKRRFSKGPPTTLIPVSRLAAPGMLIEIDAMATG